MRLLLLLIFIFTTYDLVFAQSKNEDSVIRKTHAFGIYGGWNSSREGYHKTSKYYEPEAYTDFTLKFRARNGWQAGGFFEWSVSRRLYLRHLVGYTKSETLTENHSNRCPTCPNASTTMSYSFEALDIVPVEPRFLINPYHKSIISFSLSPSFHYVVNYVLVLDNDEVFAYGRLGIEDIYLIPKVEWEYKMDKFGLGFMASYYIIL